MLRTYRFFQTDINGKCVTQYGQSTPAWGGSSSVTKTKDLSTCLNRRHHFSSIQSVPYATIPESSLLSGRVECKQTLLQGKIERVECLEEQVFKPFQENNSGARNVISQRVRLITTRPAGTPPQGKDLPELVHIQVLINMVHWQI